MAYLPQSEKDKEEEQGQQSSGAPQLSTGSSMVGSGAFGGNTAAKGPSSTGYVNLGRYLDANDDKSDEMAGRIQGGVQSNYDTNKTGLAGAEQSFVTDVNKSDIGTVGNDLLNAIKSGKANKAQIDQANKFRNTTYGGPTDITQRQDFQAANKGLSGVATDLDNSKSTGGRKQLLTGAYARDGSGKPYSDYSTGMRNLDQALLQQDQGAQQTLAGMRQSMADAGSLSQGAVDRSNTAAKDVKARLADNAGKVNTAVADRGSTVQQNINQMIAAENQRRANQAAEMRMKMDLFGNDGYSNYDVDYTANFLSGQGIGNVTAENLLNAGIDPADYFKSVTPNASATDVMDDNMKAELMALQSMGGLGGFNAGSKTNPNAYTFDTKGFGSAYDQALQQYLAEQAALNAPAQSGGGDHRTWLEKQAANVVGGFGTANIGSMF